MAADALATWITESSAAMILIVHNVDTFAILENLFQQA